MFVWYFFSIVSGCACANNSRSWRSRRCRCDINPHRHLHRDFCQDKEQGEACCPSQGFLQSKQKSFYTTFDSVGQKSSTNKIFFFFFFYFFPHPLQKVKKAPKETDPNEPDKGSAEPLSRNLGSHSSIGKYTPLFHEN